MNEGNLISIVALAGCLVLTMAGVRARQLSAPKTVIMVLMWAAIFTLAALAFSLIS